MLENQQSAVESDLERRVVALGGELQILYTKVYEDRDSLIIFTRQKGTFEPLVAKSVKSNRKLDLMNFGQTAIIVGAGNVEIGDNVNFGVVTTPTFLFGHIYVEARAIHSRIIIESTSISETTELLFQWVRKSTFGIKCSSASM